MDIQIEVIEPEPVQGPVPSCEFLPLLADNLEKYADRQTTGRVFRVEDEYNPDREEETEEVVKMCVLGVAFITASQCKAPEFDVEAWIKEQNTDPDKHIVDTDEAISAIGAFLPREDRRELSLEIERLDPRFGTYKEVVSATYPHNNPIMEYKPLDLYVLNDDWKIDFKTMAQAVRNYAAKKQAA